MRDYAKMIATVKAIQDKFGSAEFSRKEYDKQIAHDIKISRDCYGPTSALDRSNHIVKVAREEDFICKDEYGMKHVGTRYFYEVNEDFLKDLYKMIKNDIGRMQTEIVRAEDSIRKMQERIDYKRSILATFGTLCEELSLDCE